MAKVLKLAALFPKHLNLNGDHGNLLVVQRKLKWLGVAAEVIPVTNSTNLSDFDFVLVGHGSKAAWDEILRLDTDFVNNLVSYIESDKPALVVASAYDLVSKNLLGKQNEQLQHRSLFVKTSDDVVGYVNSDSQASELVWHKNALLTLLHGPLLAKNPKLADELIHRMGIEVNSDAKEFALIEELAEASRRIAFEN